MVKNITKLALFFLILSVIASYAIAQEDEAKYEFNGKVGRLSSFSDDYESTVMIELNIAYSITKHIAVSGGAIFTNFQGPSQILLGGQDLLDYFETLSPYRVDKIRMDEQIFIGKIILKAGGKRFSPYASFGLGGYQFRYRQNVFVTNPLTLQESALPVYFQNTVLGFNAGAGLNFYLNDFLAIKFDACYHKVFYELIDKQMTISAGFGFLF
jgi:hypothetical protein